MVPDPCVPSSFSRTVPLCRAMAQPQQRLKGATVSGGPLSSSAAPEAPAQEGTRPGAKVHRRGLQGPRWVSLSCALGGVEGAPPGPPSGLGRCKAGAVGISGSRAWIAGHRTSSRPCYSGLRVMEPLPVEEVRWTTLGQSCLRQSA
jgi:hypothetical protein